MVGWVVETKKNKKFLSLFQICMSKSNYLQASNLYVIILKCTPLNFVFNNIKLILMECLSVSDFS